MKSRAVAILGFLTFVTTFFAVACGAAPTGENIMLSDEGLDSGYSEPIGGWSAAGQMTALDTLKSVHLQAIFKKPGPYTVQFAVQQLTANVDTVVEPKAIIDWSVAGNTITRKVDALNGASITGVGEGVRVRVVDETSTGNAVDYAVTITVAPGVRPAKPDYPTLTPVHSGNPQVVAVNSTAVFTVPEGVGVAAVSVKASYSTIPIAPASPITDQMLIVTHRAPVGTIDPALKRYDPRESDWVPLAPGTTEVWVNNVGAANLRIQLSWGVDG